MGAAVVLLTACNGVPSDVIQPHDMAALMADIHLGEAVVEQSRATFPTDSVKQLFKQSIYAAHGVTAAEVDSSMMWYGRHVEKYNEVYEEVEKILDAKIAEANEIASTASERAPILAFEAEGDSVDIWPSYRTSFLSPNFPSDRIPFFIKSDRFWENGDIYCLRFKAVNAPEKFDVTIAGEYSNGAVDYASQQPQGDGWHQIYLHLNDTLSATGLYGAIVYQEATDYIPGRSVEARIDSISLVRMRIDNGSRLPRNQKTIHSIRR